MIPTTGRYLSGDAFDEETCGGNLMIRGSPLEGVDDGAGGAAVPAVDLDVLVKVVRAGKPL